MTENPRPSWDDLVQLITELDGSDFDNVAVEYDDISVRMSRGALAEPATAPVTPAAGPQSTTPAPAPAAAAAPAAEPAAEPAATASHGTPVTSPMVGFFYRSPSPGALPFVTEGDTVTAETTIGIIEVMKLMNPVQAGIAGTVTGFAAEDAQAVEFGEDLLYISPEDS